VKELRLASICNIDAGNTFLTRFLDRFNQRFAIPPAKPEDVTGHLILQRAVLATSCATASSVMWERSSASTMTASRSSLTVLSSANKEDGQSLRPQPFWRSASGRLCVFREDQRVSHTVIVENEWLPAEASLRQKISWVEVV
jgi:hypothetical protein